MPQLKIGDLVELRNYKYTPPLRFYIDRIEGDTAVCRESRSHYGAAGFHTTTTTYRKLTDLRKVD